MANEEDRMHAQGMPHMTAWLEHSDLTCRAGLAALPFPPTWVMVKPTNLGDGEAAPDVDCRSQHGHARQGLGGGGGDEPASRQHHATHRCQPCSAAQAQCELKWKVGRLHAVQCGRSMQEVSMRPVRHKVLLCSRTVLALDVSCLLLQACHRNEQVCPEALCCCACFAWVVGHVTNVVLHPVPTWYPGAPRMSSQHHSAHLRWHW